MGAFDRGPAPLHAGELAGPWRIEQELGHGGMGTVYAVVHEDIGKRAALKVVHPHALTPWFTAERFLLEARVVNCVDHPGIVDIFETGTLADGRPYLVMERLDGETLAARAQGGITRERACAILLAVCDVMRAAHAAGIVHRDLKLDNVFLLPDVGGGPRVKVLDWGIAKIITGEPTNTFAERLIGTPRYLSPEQARGIEVTTRADIYSLGVMMYEMFLGRAPFGADSTAELLTMHLRDEPPPPRAYWAQCPLVLERLLLDMLAKTPEERPTIEEVAARLAEVRTHLHRHRIAFAPDAPPAPRPVSRTTRTLRTLRAHQRRMLQALALVALFGGVAATARTNDEAPTAVAIARSAAVRALPAPPARAILTAPIAVAVEQIAATSAVPSVDDPHERAPAPIARHRHHARRPAPSPSLPVSAPPALTSPAPVHPVVATTPSMRHAHRVASTLDRDGTIEPYP